MYQMPRVSVIMPVFNGARFLREAIESVLAQTLSDFEFLVIDDGSTDQSVEIVLSYVDARIKLLKNEKNLGLPVTRNRGVEEARAPYIAFLDCDDIAHPSRLQLQIDFLEANQKIVGVGASAKPIDAFGNVTGADWICPEDVAYCKARLLFGAYFNTSTFTVRTEILRQVQFDPQIGLAEDYDLYTRICEKFALVNLPETLVYCRVHGNNITILRKHELRSALNEISFRHLNALGINPTPAEMVIHRHIEWNDLTPNDRLLSDVSSWLLKVQEHNKLVGIYSTLSLAKVASDRWYASCEAALRKGYRPALFAYYRSPLFSMKYFNTLANIKLAARVFIPRAKAS